MSFNVAILEAMQTEGLDLAACIRVLSAGEKVADPTAAARMAKMRAKRKGVTPVTVTPNVTRNTPPNDSILTPHEKPSKPSGLVANPRKHRLPIDWEPMPFRPGTSAALVVVRWEPGRLERELAKFRDHHTAAGTRFEVWQAAWSKWVNGSQDFGGRNGGQQHHPNIGKSQAAYALLGLRDDQAF